MLYEVITLRKNLINATFLIVIASILHGLLDLFFYFALWSYEKYNTVFFERTIPTIILTILFSPAVYFIVKFIMKKFSLTQVITVENTEESEDKNKF